MRGLQRTLLAVLLATAVLAPALPAAAQVIPKQIVPEQCTYRNVAAGECNICYLGVMVINLTNFLIFAIAFPATVLLLAAGGIVLMTAGPSPSRLELGKKLLTNTFVGLVIVLVSWLAVDTIIKVLTLNERSFRGLQEAGFGPWYKIPVERCQIQG